MVIFCLKFLFIWTQLVISQFRNFEFALLTFILTLAFERDTIFNAEEKKTLVSKRRFVLKQETQNLSL